MFELSIRSNSINYRNLCKVLLRFEFSQRPRFKNPDAFLVSVVNAASAGSGFWIIHRY